MRLLLLHNRIYRAFPELDGYTDDRCQKFVKAAQRGTGRRVFHAALIFAVSALVLVGGLSLAYWFVEQRLDGFGGRHSWFLEAGPIFIPIGVAPLVGFFTRDILLRRRVRWVLRTRGSCPVCRYSLIGLPVSAANTVTCPECALKVEVDPSLGELALDESGMGRFKPSPAALPPPSRIFTPKRVRRLKRAVTIVGLILAVGLPTLWGGYEWFLRRQAATARTEKPGSEALMALVEANQPAGSEGQANAWDFLQEASTIESAADLADEQQNPLPQGGGFSYPDFWAIVTPHPPDADPATAREDALNEAKARRLIDAYRAGGLYAVLDRAAQAPRAIRPTWTPPGEPLFESARMDTAPARDFARINAARMTLAQEKGDFVEYMSALESTLALARCAAHQPFIMDGLVAVAIEGVAYDRLQKLLATHPSPAWLDAIAAAIVRQKSRPKPGLEWEGDRLMAVDTIAWLFGDPAHVRWGRLPSELQDRIYGAPETWVGTYAQNRDALNSYYRASAELASTPRWQRPAEAANSDEGSGAPLAALFGAGRGTVLRSYDQCALVREGYGITAALERFYAAQGAYPESLDALAPSFLPAIAVDPWTGKAWGYHLRAADAHPEDPRGFILYSFGEDGKDDGGHRHEDINHDALNPSRGDGHDFIINDWRPPGE